MLGREQPDARELVVGHGVLLDPDRAGGGNDDSGDVGDRGVPHDLGPGGVLNEYAVAGVMRDHEAAQAIPACTNQDDPFSELAD